MILASAARRPSSPFLLRGGRIGRIGRRVVSYAALVSLAVATAGADALAADECGPAAPGAVIDCTGLTYNPGITYSGVDGLTLALDNPSMTLGNTSSGRGVSVSGSGAGNVTVNATSFSQIST
ncbi:hypothetical protein, partial [Aestuariivirga sp.]|uniref:hypothetical protein n=1 Tax=Aestuariivirga sp. TaxID=2650926 RepID=UPI00301659F8